MKFHQNKLKANHPTDNIPLEERHTLNLGELLSVEKKYIKKRREERGEDTNIFKDSLGIALSGGGIRSATICLGVMEKLNELGIIEKADYLSSVSGGGYLASYIHSALNKKEQISYDKLFDKQQVIEHLRTHRTHLFLWPKKKCFSVIWLFLVAILSFVISWLWIILPFFFFLSFEMNTYWHYIAVVLLAVVPSFFLSPNFTSLHRYYKNRLKKAYLWLDESIKIKDLTKFNTPYPLINATIHVDKDDYYKAKSVSYRGRIRTNYFLFSPLYCGSQVTRYTRTSKSLYSNYSLATAMATSGAAVNTFMGNMNLATPIRWIMLLSNLRTGILAPSPFLKTGWPVFWPYYTLLEMIGKAKTTSYKIQVSDGGHIENLAIYELLRRKVKTIIAIDSGQDDKFDFSDLRNLIIRARNELGTIIDFGENSNPLEILKPSLITGASKNHFAIARISGLEGSYSKGYEGILVYIKSSVLPMEEFRLRVLKNKTALLKEDGKLDESESIRRELDHVMYRAYTPDFPHQSTVNQFFSEEQWDAYYHLGKKMGNSFIHQMNIKVSDSRLKINQKCHGFLKRKNDSKNQNK